MKRYWDGKRVTKYLANWGLSCPFCDSEDITSSDEYSLEKDGLKINVRCDKCNTDWTDVFKLIGVE